MVNLINSFNPQQGLLVAIAFDPISGNVFIYDDFATVIRQYLPNGTFVSTTPFSGTTSNDIDLDFAPEAINVKGTTVTENALLIANGDDTPDTLKAINKTTGAAIGPSSTVLPTTSLVGASYHATRKTFFAVNYANDTIQEINLATGAAINSFSVAPTGSPAFDVFYGDVEVNQASGNLFIVSSSQNKIRELTPTGAFVRDIDVTPFGVTGMSGIAFDDAKGEAYISSTNGTVYRLNGFAALPTIPTITLAISPISVLENGVTNLVYTFTRTGSTTGALTVNFGVAGTATLTSDYTQAGAASFTGTTGSITFTAGASSKTITVDPTGDTIVEANETVALTLTSNSAYTIGTTGAVTGTITNDDSAPTLPTITLSVSPRGISEDATADFIYTFTRSSTTGTLVVNFNVSGTAALSSDYVATGATSFSSSTGQVTFASGATTATVTLNPTGDTTVETNETINLTLASGTGYTVGTTTAQTATIIGDDGTRRQQGTNGNDVLLGKAKTDILIGGLGNDSLTGAEAGDLFTFQSSNEGIDRITDFAVGDDLIVVKATGFVGGLTSGDTITPQQFVIGTAATTSSHRFIYNSTSGALFFDNDGSGGTAAIQFATLNANLLVTNEDILVS